MRKIIDGYRLDTDTAVKVGEASYDGSSSDFGWWEEALYKTPRSGMFFTVGSGGPRSNYAVSAGQGSWSGSRDVFRILAPKAAFAWAQAHLPTEVIEEHFGGMITDA